ncbi:MAG: hypothetical protein ACJ754_24490 [Pyrinomonadaceae bacterium]
MSDTSGAVQRPFEFKAGTVTTAEGDALEVDVRNLTGAVWDGFLFIELKLPMKVVAPKVGTAALDARQAEEPLNMATLAGVVTAAEGWSVWAINDPNDSIVVIRVFNDIDQLDGKVTETKTALGAGAVLKLRIPLAPGTLSTQFEMEYGYQTGEGSETRVDGSLVLTPSQLEKFELAVSLICEHESPTMIDPGEVVTITWSIKNGVAATLRGPLPGGNSELTLSRDPTSNYRLDKGVLSILAVGPATYVLDAEVKGPEGQPNVQVVRTLTLDIYSPDKYARVNVRPDSVLPNGQVEIDWAVWGVEKASLKVGNRVGLDLELTEQNLSRTYQGSGVLVIHAAENKESENVSLTFTSGPKRGGAEPATIQTSPWLPLKKPAITGSPIALAVADGNMALLMSDGLYTGRVGLSDMELKSQQPSLAKSGALGKAWHALTALGKDFVVLRRTDGDEVVLERFDGKGVRNSLPVTLPGDFQTLARHDGTQFQLVGFGERVYVVADALVFGRPARSAYSVKLSPETHVRAESRLTPLTNYQLLNFAGALYAYHRDSGRMVRFGLTKELELDEPLKAATAVNAEGVSMIKTGLLVPVGSVLAVLDPAALPSFQALKITGLGLNNLFELAHQSLRAGRAASDLPQDLCYNPQRDAWMPCGHGLDIEPGAVAAYRGGKSKRLWVLQGNGALHTLTSAHEALFAPDFLDRLHPKDLPPAIDAKRWFQFANMTGLDLVPVDEVCKGAGLGPFSADGPAEVTPLPPGLKNLSFTEFNVSYSSTHTTEVKLRLTAARAGSPRYLFELTLSGEGLGTVTSVFKRLATDGRLDEVPGTSLKYNTGERNVVVKPATPLHATTRLNMLNATPGELRLTSTAGTVSMGERTPVGVDITTPELTITTPNGEKAGRVRVTFDYAKPMGIELSPGDKAQEKLIRVVTNESNMLEVSADFLSVISSVVFTFEKYDGSPSARALQQSDTYWLRVGLKKKLVLDGVRLGDGALSPDRKAIFIPLARPENVKQVRVVKYEVGSLASSEKSYETQGDVYSVPNAITVSGIYYDVMFAEPIRYSADHKFGVAWPQRFDGYAEVVALTSSVGRSVFNVGKRLEGFPERLPKYFLTVAYLGNDREETPLDNIARPVGAAPLAVTADGSKAAICDPGGFLLVDMTAPVGTRKAQSVRMLGTHEPAHAVFSNDGSFLFLAHVRRLMSGSGPRRVVAGRDIIVTRYGVKQYRMENYGLPHVESDFGLTANTRQGYSPHVTYKEQVALSLAVSPDDRWLFVSTGTSILRFNLDKFTLDPWSTRVELPCRLIGVAEGGSNSWTVYALGSYYVGDGTKVDEYKTHLYFIEVPKG